jgi:hypothetical protein
MIISSAEFERQCRVVDQMITAHSTLRDRYARYGLSQDVLVLLLSTGLVATALVDPGGWSALGITPEVGRIAMAIIAISVFASTVVDLRVRWKEKSGAHGLAARTLAELKANARLINAEASPEAAGEWTTEVRRALVGLPEISESQFLGLKARHVRKIALSKLIDQHPGGSLLVLRAVLYCRRSVASVTGKREDE